MPPETYTFPNSSHVRSAEYDRDRRSLTIRFHNGNTHTEPSVEPTQWRGLKLADSPGGYIAQTWPRGRNR